MKKIVLIDGNNLIYRSYFATAYSGNIMKNSKGFPTNALYGLVNMLNKIIAEEKPHYLLVALDKGKTFRHEAYKEYKAGRKETPSELKMQFAKAKELMAAMGIVYLDKENYEADDIIGTFAKRARENDTYEALIISSDKDLLQLVGNDVSIKLLKSNAFDLVTEENFLEKYQLTPEKIIDLKALMGDSSDNIPGVKGIGEKTALKLLIEHGDLDGVYKNVESFSPKLKEKLVNDKSNAYLSYELATIDQDVPLDQNFIDFSYQGPNIEKLKKIYEELEFSSFLRNMDKVGNIKKVETIKTEIISKETKLDLQNKVSIYVELKEENYHTSKVLGLGIYDNKKSYFLPFDLFDDFNDLLMEKEILTYDAKKLIVTLNNNNINFKNVSYDLMLAGYLLEYGVKDDLSYLALEKGETLPYYDKKEEDVNIIANRAGLKAKFIFDTKAEFIKELADKEMFNLYNDIEFPLTFVLAEMELNGVLIHTEFLKKMGKEIFIKMELIASEIYNLAGEEFNILSPKQLGEILFTKLGLKHGKKTKTGFSTKREILEKIKEDHEIVPKISEYRNLAKLHSNYIEGLISLVHEDGKIHTIYNQTLTRTGRLSSKDPNIQNIPIRLPYGSKIRKAFIPSLGNKIMAADYSQIELRVLAHIANAENLIKAFQDGKDIHTITASKIFSVEINQVTKSMRGSAKAVNFGIVYGISSFGLAEDIKISIPEAKEFIDKYLKEFPGVKKYMENTIAKAYENGYVLTYFNRKRSIPELQNKNFMVKQGGERIALNTPIQGTSADIIKLAMIKIQNEIKTKKLKSKMLIQVHDELVFDVDPSEEKEFTEIIKNSMEKILELKVPLKVDMDSGESWYEAK